jgi:hypothetical protein
VAQTPQKLGSLVRDRVHDIANESQEELVIDELLVHLGVVLEQELHHLAKGLVVGHPRGVRVFSFAF